MLTYLLLTLALLSVAGYYLGRHRAFAVANVSATCIRCPVSMALTPPCGVNTGS